MLTGRTHSNGNPCSPVGRVTWVRVFFKVKGNCQIHAIYERVRVSVRVENDPSLVWSQDKTSTEMTVIMALSSRFGLGRVRTRARRISLGF